MDGNDEEKPSEEYVQSFIEKLENAHEVIGQLYVCSASAIGALEYAINDYACSLNFLSQRQYDATISLQSFQDFSQLEKHQRKQQNEKQREREIQKVLKLARQARRVSINDMYNYEIDNESDSEEDLNNIPQPTKIPEALRLPPAFVKKVRVYKETLKEFHDKKMYSTANSGAEVNKLKDQTWSKAAAANKAMSIAKEVMLSHVFKEDDNDTALLLAHVSRVLRISKQVLHECSLATTNDKNDEAEGWRWRDDCLRTFASVNAKTNKFEVSHGPQYALSHSMYEKRIVDMWVPIKVLETYLSIAINKVNISGDKNYLLPLLSSYDFLESDHPSKEVPGAAKTQCFEGEDSGQLLELNAARQELMTTILQLHIESSVLAPLVECMKLLKRTTTETTVLHARLISWLKTGKRKHLRVFRLKTNSF